MRIEPLTSETIEWIPYQHHELVKAYLDIFKTYKLQPPVCVGEIHNPEQFRGFLVDDVAVAEVDGNTLEIYQILSESLGRDSANVESEIVSRIVFAQLFPGVYVPPTQLMFRAGNTRYSGLDVSSSHANELGHWSEYVSLTYDEFRQLTIDEKIVVCEKCGIDFDSLLRFDLWNRVILNPLASYKEYVLIDDTGYVLPIGYGHGLYQSQITKEVSHKTYEELFMSDFWLFEIDDYSRISNQLKDKVIKVPAELVPHVVAAEYLEYALSCFGIKLEIVFSED